jgi:hypothetical protein
MLPTRPHVRIKNAWQMANIRPDYAARVRLSDAHCYVRSLDAIETLSIHLLRYINFELFVPCLLPVEELATHLQTYHCKYKGRTEIRDRILGRGVHHIALDVALYCRNKNRAVEELLKFLHETCRVKRAGMHRGKYQLLSLAPIELVDGYGWISSAGQAK